MRDKEICFLSKEVMGNNRLTIEAKGIYSYLCKLAETNNMVSVPLDAICRDLNISERRFYKHRKALENNSYIEIIRKKEKGKFKTTIYKILV